MTINRPLQLRLHMCTCVCLLSPLLVNTGTKYTESKCLSCKRLRLVERDSHQQ